MPYILEKILNVREHREEKKLNHMVQRKAAVKRAVTVRRKREQELFSYRQWRPVEEKRLFDHLQSKPVNVHDVMYFSDTINTLREDQAAKARMVQEASNQVTSAENDLKTARQHYAEACRKKMKIVEHKTIWMEEHRIQTEQQEENELEEIGQFAPSRSRLI